MRSNLRLTVMMSLAALAGVLGGGAEAVVAQPINLDFGAGANTPAPTFGGAAGQAGTWQAVVGGTTAPIALRDASGADTEATLVMSHPVSAGGIADSGVVGDEGSLLNDFLDLSHARTAGFEFRGVRPGMYGVYVYAWAADNPASPMTVSATGATPQTTGGFWPGALQAGVTHAEFHVRIDGPFSVAVTNHEDLGALNGVHLVPELLFLRARLVSPIPAAIAPGSPFWFDVVIEPNDEAVQGAALRYRLRPEQPFADTPLTPLGGTLYRATLPAPACGDRPEFSLVAVGSIGGERALQDGDGPFRVGVGTPSAETLLSQDFEPGGGLAGWTMTGLWHATSACPVAGGEACASGSSVSFAQDDSCTYDTGVQATGLLVAPPLDLSGVAPGKTVELSFCYAKQTKAENGVEDIARVLVNWQPVAGLDDTDGWAIRTIDLTPFAGESAPVTIALLFDSRDAFDNAHRGLAVDTLRVTERGFACGDACAADQDGSGAVTVADIFAYLSLWFAQDPSADLDGATGITVADIFAFLSVWFAGCG